MEKTLVPKISHMHCKSKNIKKKKCEKEKKGLIDSFLWLV